YSLRHTYICLRLMEGADIYQIAKNCRTSVEMIEKHYAAHIKNTLDAAAINVMRPKAAKVAEKLAKAVSKTDRQPKAVRKQTALDVAVQNADSSMMSGSLTAETNG
ncbi:MAG: hypothetical protein POH28_12725, partial [Acidocella sp.]|nr:hypothetical protein [Acidocella sp.]